MPELPHGTPRSGQERFVADAAEVTVRETDAIDTEAPPESQWKEAWKRLRKNVLFWISSALLLVLAVVMIAPGLFTDVPPQGPGACNLIDSLEPGRDGSPFGFTKQGCDVWSRTLYGARASVLVGVLTTVGVAIIGIITGAVAGFFGGWVDSLVSRLSDVFFAIPLLLASIVVLSVINNLAPDRGFWGGVFAVVTALTLFGWPQITRQMRGAVLEVKNLEFVDAAKAIGATRMQNLVRHIVPNSLAPVIVTSTITLGIFIVAEAVLSFLGIGLPRSRVVSWGNDISTAQVDVLRTGDHLTVIAVPSAALALTVLAFILLGDAVSDALDPKASKQ